MFGGHGSSAMLEIAKKLDQSSQPLQLILLCGHNLELAAKLRNLGLKKPVVIEGFTSKVESFMALGDFFVGKPGPGSISEALQFGLPVIVEHNARTMPQERYNGTWLVEKRLGMEVIGLPRNRERGGTPARAHNVRGVPEKRRRLQELCHL